MCFDNGNPTSVRILPWGDGDITTTIAECLQISREKAEELRKDGLTAEASDAVLKSFDALARYLIKHCAGHRIYLTGGNLPANSAAQLGKRLGLNMECERVEVASS